MSGLLRVVKTTVLGGMLFLVPFIVLTIILGKAHQISSRLVGPIAEVLPFDSLIGMPTPKVGAVVVLIVFCFFAGLFSKARLAKRLVGWLEDSLLVNIPGYLFIKHIGEEIAGADASVGYQAVLVEFDDLSQVGLLVERLEDGSAVVFMPGAPNPRSGDVIIAEESRVKLLTVPTTKALKTFQKLGEGTGALLGASKSPTSDGSG